MKTLIKYWYWVIMGVSFLIWLLQISSTSIVPEERTECIRCYYLCLYQLINEGIWGQPKQFSMIYLQFIVAALWKISGSWFPKGKVINRATIIGISPIDINKFLSSIFLDNSPTDPKQIVTTHDPIVPQVPRYLTVSSLDHPHISIANGEATLEFDVHIWE